VCVPKQSEKLWLLNLSNLGYKYEKLNLITHTHTNVGKATKHKNNNNKKKNNVGKIIRVKLSAKKQCKWLENRN